MFLFSPYPNTYYLVYFLKIASLIAVRWYHLVVFLMISHIEHIFIFLLAICMFSLEKCLFSFSSLFKSDCFFAPPYIFFYEFYNYRACIQIFNTFESVFVYGVRQGSSFILLNVAVQFSSTIYWRGYPFPIVCFFVVNQLTIYVWVYFWFSILFHWSMCLFLC